MEGIFKLKAPQVCIGHACKRLLSSEENIHIIANKSGFNSVSNFNRFFKEIKGKTPGEFKKHLVM
ncbi:helix-turn-helix domain-containing protein [Chitinophaga sp. 22321]|uniref:Helix-turn-helix domain-containing protein n=1 Tax=Chitinophaga hostae TaxID=2831022 RepID=A0ABS5J6D0_9BACT|nr:helix-turn-helix domain-containing protein [Chitinophaga hostae]MBS0030621.1 helix-turn-helix domain-containing protein [Chitinophaga hostae]